MSSNGSPAGGFGQPKRPANAPSLEERYPLNPAREKANPNRPFFIDFVRKSGQREAFAYTDLIWISFEESKTKIVFHFSSHTPEVLGFRLQSIYERALRQELDRVEETRPPYDSDDGEGPVVKEIRTPRVESKRTEMDQDFPLDPEAEGG